jgi:hypothetical protein
MEIACRFAEDRLAVAIGQHEPAFGQPGQAALEEPAGGPVNEPHGLGRGNGGCAHAALLPLRGCACTGVPFTHRRRACQ